MQKVERMTGRALTKMRKSILSQHPLCEECQKHGRITVAEEIDHKNPLHKGGTHDRENLQALCKACHAEKTRRDCGYKPKPEIGLDGWPTR